MCSSSAPATGLIFLKGSNVSSGSTAKAPSVSLPGSSPHQPAPPSPAADAFAAGSFALVGKSNPPDPTIHAYRKDLADVALAGRVVSSHYAEPLLRHLATDAAFVGGREDGAATIAMLAEGDELYMLDCSLGWAWGYAGAQRRVGYVRATALKP